MTGTVSAPARRRTTGVTREQVTVEGQTCARCKKWRDADLFALDGRRATRLKHVCRSCVREYDRERGARYAADPRRDASHKVCRACDAVKPRSAFTRKSSAPDGLDHRCRSCKLADKHRRKAIAEAA